MFKKIGKGIVKGAKVVGKAPVKGFNFAKNKARKTAIGTVVLGVLVALDQYFTLGISQDLLKLVADFVANALNEASGIIVLGA